MIKHVVGKVRASYFQLPDEDFTFGRKTPKQEMTAGSIISNWSTHLDSKSHSQNGIKTPVKCMNKSYEHETHAPINYDHVYGIKNVANDVPMKELLKCPQHPLDDNDYPDRSNMKKKGRLPRARSTKASRCLETSIKNASMECSIENIKSPFKMKKFLKVESKVKKIIGGSS